jgi:CPA2 family monovalent cation:H+ antiporter-2
MTGHETPFIATIVISLALAYAGGLCARLLGLSKIIGYLAAGVLVGPYTPGFVADQKLTMELAEIGVALLMFTIGLHFSVRDLVAVWHIAVPGAVLQVAACTALGSLVGYALGWPVSASMVLGLAIAISSTAVATKELEARSQLQTETGRIVLGWLVVQDIVVIIALVLLPTVSRGATDFGSLAIHIGETVLMISIFVGLLLGLGRWLLPAILSWTARIGSQELFTLGVIVIALGIAYGSAAVLGLSLALGAFFAGMVLGESDLSHQSAAESLPIQNIFTVLFFVSVGMLLDPLLFLRTPMEIAVLFLAISAGCGLTVFATMMLLGVPARTAGGAAGTLAQIGEFTFILTGLAVSLAIMTSDQRGMLLAAAIVTILVHSLTIRAYRRLGDRLDRRLAFLKRNGRTLLRSEACDPGVLRNHVVIVGYGRVGRVVAAALKEAGRNFAVIEAEWRAWKDASEKGIAAIFGDATHPEVFHAANTASAQLMIIALPDPFQARRVIELARAARPGINIIARAHSDEEYHYLTQAGVGLVIMGEREIALSMSDYALRHMGLDAQSAQTVVDDLRTSFEMRSVAPADAA